MNKQEIINTLNNKPYPRNEYWIVSGAGLVMHGVKAETRDIDIGCSAALANLLIENGAKLHVYKDGTRQINEDDDIELLEDWCGDALVEIDGFRVASLESIRNMKVKLNRPKDLEDITLINEFLNPNAK